MSVRESIREDPTARKILQGFTIIITFAMAIPGLFSLVVIGMADNLPEAVEYIIDHLLPFFHTIPGDIISIVLGAAPAVVAGVCYKTTAATHRLNIAGMICATVAVIGFVCSVIGIAALRSEESALSNIGGENTILNLLASTEVAARSSLFYLAIFFGIGGAKNEN